MKCIRLILFAVSVLFSYSSILYADIINIPDDFETIQAGIEAADDEDIVLIAPGEYDENIDFLGKAIRVTSHIHLEDNPGFIQNTIIDGGRRDCVVTFSNEEGRNSVLRGFTIRNGLQGYGGGIDCRPNSSPLLEDLIIRENEADSNGGGIYFSTNSTPLIRNTIIEENTADFGAGVASEQPARATISNTTIRNNIAVHRGGGIHTVDASLNLDHVAIVGNQCRSSGGGIRQFYSYGNVFTNVTIASNTSNNYSAIEYYYGDVTMTNCIIYNNGERSIRFQNPPQGGIDISFSNIARGLDNIFVQNENDLIYDESNFDENPLFVDPDNGNYHIEEDSPCIDTGNPESPRDPDLTRADVGAFFFDQHELEEDAPDVDIFWEIGQEDNLIDWNTYFENLYRDGAYPVPLSIRNIGTEELVINGIFSDNDVFTANPRELRLESRENAVVNLVFSPDVPGEYDGILVIESNDPDEDEIDIDLRASAASPAIIDIDIEEVSVELNPGESFERELIIMNEGETDLNWRLERELVSEPEHDNRRNGPLRDLAGAILAQHEVPFADTRGLTWDGHLMWGICTDNNPGNLIALDPVSGETIYNYQLDIYPYGMFWDGELLWISNMNQDDNTINKYDWQGNLVDQVNFPFSRVSYMTFNGDNLIFVKLWNDRNRVHIVTYDELEEIAVINLEDIQGFNNPEDISLRSFTCIPAPDGEALWAGFTDGSRYICQFHIDDDWNIEMTYKFHIRERRGLTIEHDGQNLWQAENEDRQTWNVLDDGIQETDWFYPDITTGVLEQNRDQSVFITFNAYSLINGEYRGILHIISNDPDDPDVGVRIELDVTSAPDLEIGWTFETEDRLININDYYESLYVGGEYVIPLYFRNLGSDRLAVGEFEFESRNFEVDWQNFILDVNERLVVNVTFSPDEPGVFEEIMNVQSNDPDGNDLEIMITGEVLGAPEIVIDQGEFEAEQQTNQITVQDLVIRNEGLSPLNWTSRKEIVREPDIDNRDAGPRRMVRNISRVETITPTSPFRDDPGDQIGFYNLPWDRINGLDYDGELIWGIANTNLLWAFNQEENELIHLFGIDRTRQNGISCFGNEIWVLTNAGGNWSTIIKIYNRDGELLREHDTETENVDLITHDLQGNHYLYYARESTLRAFSSEHELLGVIPFRNDLNIRVGGLRGLDWTKDHQEGNFWILFSPPVNENDNMLCIQFDINEEWHAVEVQRIEIDDRMEYMGLTHDGKDLVLYGTEYRPPGLMVIDDGFDEPYWISIEPDEGSLEPGEESIAEITFDSENLIAGEYVVLLAIHSNDPINPITEVEISLSVFGAPEIEVTWEIGMDNNEIDYNRCFDFVYVDQRYTVPITIRNNGGSVLEIDRVEFNNDVFRARPEQIEVQLREETNLRVTFSPDEVRLHNGQMSIFSNDPENGELVINLTGRALAPPGIVVVPDQIDVGVLRGEILESELTISNQGVDELQWIINIDQPEEFDLDPGEIIATHNHNLDRAAGLTWDGELIWGVERLDVCAYNPETGENVREFRTGRFADNIAFDGQNLILGGQMQGRNREIREYDLQGNFLELWEWNSDFESMASDQNGHLLLQIRNEDHIQIVDIRTHNSAGGFDTEDMFDRETRKMTWVPAHPQGQLWFLAEGRLSQFYIDEDWNPAFVKFIDADINYENLGITHDGDNLWHAKVGERNILHVIHDGIVENPFLIANPVEGITGRNVEVDIELMFNIDLIPEPGEYLSILHVISNDPLNDDIEIDITLTAFPHPIIEADPIPEPMPNAHPIVFPEVTFGEFDEEITFTISNSGIDDLLIREIIIENQEDFSTDLEEGTIVEVETSVQARIIYHPSAPGELNGQLHIFTNAPNVGEGDNVGHVWFDLQGICLTQPQIETEPGAEEEISLVALIDDNPVNRILRILNSAGEGAANLDFDIRSIEVSEEEGDRDGNLDRKVRSISRSRKSPLRDDPGDLLRQYEIPFPFTDGMAWDGELMWGVSFGNDRLWALNPANGEFELNINLQDPGTIAFDGENLWIGFSRDNTIGIFDLEGNQIERFNSPFEVPIELASDKRNYIFIVPNQIDQVFVMTIEDREIITGFPFMQALEGGSFSGMMWVAEHPNGQMWVVGNRTAYQIFVDKYHGDNRLDWSAEPVGNFGWEANQSSRAIAHDGENIWHAPLVARTLLVRDDGVKERHQLSWLTIEPESGSIESGDQIEITLTINPEGLAENTSYPGEILIESNDFDDLITVIPITLSTEFELRHFNDFIETDSNHLLNISSLIRDDEEALTGCEIGVFTPDEILAGASIWIAGEDEPLEIDVYGDIPQTEALEGFRENEEFLFRIWDDFSNTEWDVVQVVFEEGPDVWRDGGQTLLSIYDQLNHELIININQGWNLNSINVDPRDLYIDNDDPGPSVQHMFEQLRIDEENHRIALIKNEQGQFYAPAWDFDNLGYWVLTDGYQINATVDCEAVISGIPISFRRNVPLNPGWNLIAYFPTFDLDVSAPDYYGFSSIIDMLVIAKDSQGRFISPEFEFSNMPPLRETQGYKLLINNDQEFILNYPERQEELAWFRGSNSQLRDDLLKPPNTGKNMSVLVNNISGLNISTGDQLSAYSLDGGLVGLGLIDENCRCGLPVWGDDECTEKVNGLIDGQTFVIMGWDETLDREIELEVETILHGSDLTYKTDSFLVINLRTKAIIPDHFYLIQPYPNPFNSTTRITYGLSNQTELSLSIFDITGRKIADLVNNIQPAGEHTLIWEANNSAAGIYLIKMECERFSSVRKVVLVR